jgi:asparagine synthase (glutamine-hydrolysing)
MCGIAGILDLRCKYDSALGANATAMIGTLAHRGPDGEGAWIDSRAGIALCHRRLAIVDLSQAGNQPMISLNGRFVISYNGEVYNAPELAAELRTRGIGLRGHSDTEVVLECCSLWGIEDCVQRLNGMFAFAVWDRQQRTLTFVRDRCGIKPVYWAKFGSLFLFGSELKALQAHPDFVDELDRGAIASFMRFGYIPAPGSIFRNVFKLEPGHILTIDSTGAVQDRCYWDIRNVAVHSVRRARQDVIEELDELLNDAVRRCMISDVPLGAFLSGGVDSSTVVALMQANSPQPIRTFTIGFDDSGFDEAIHARAVAAHLGTHHSELYVNDQDLLNIVPRLSYYFDEPFADPSQIPTFLLSELTHRQVSVALSGDGGDELFGGYSRYFQAERLWKAFACIPLSARPHAGRLLNGFSRIARGSDRLSSLLALDAPLIEDKWHKLCDFLTAGDSLALYRQLQSSWPRPEDLVLNATEGPGLHWDRRISQELPQLMDQFRLVDFLTYLPDHVLTKVDRATMSTGLEARVPLLDHRIIAFAWSVPSALHTQDGKGKSLLREILARYVPRRLFERPKWGFMPPLASWLRGPLKEWANDLLDEGAIRDQGILNAQLVRARWLAYCRPTDRKQEWCSPLWNVLTLQTWLATRKNHRPKKVAERYAAIC